MITVDYNLLKRQIRLLSRKLSSVELKPNEKALLDGLFDLLNSIEHEKPLVEEDEEICCSTCNNVTPDMQSTYCGTFCVLCLIEHCEECDACAIDFP